MTRTPAMTSARYLPGGYFCRPICISGCSRRAGDGTGAGTSGQAGLLSSAGPGSPWPLSTSPCVGRHGEFLRPPSHRDTRRTPDRSRMRPARSRPPIGQRYQRQRLNETRHKTAILTATMRELRELRDRMCELREQVRPRSGPRRPHRPRPPGHRNGSIRACSGRVGPADRPRLTALPVLRLLNYLTAQPAPSMQGRKV